MKKYLIVIMLFITQFIAAQEIRSYNLNMNINTVDKIVHVEGIINIDFQNKDSIDFVLWKNSLIKEISIPERKLEYVFDTVAASPMFYIHNGKRLTVLSKNIGTGDQSVKFVYDCDFKNLSGWGLSFTEDWIELNYYCAWYPVYKSGGNSTSNINVHIDPNYSISGSGIISHEDDIWKMKQPWKSFDNVIVASKYLKSKKLEEKSVSIQTDYSALPESSADSILIVCKNIFNLFQNYFGKKDSTFIKFVIAPFEKGGGYSRKYFVRMGTKKFNDYTQQGFAHEIAHFWWSSAPASSWEDWLNEAFAEYSMLIFTREYLGSEKYEKKIAEYQNRSQNLPCIWGIDRNSKDAYSTIYEKGSLILCEMEKKIGTQKFLQFLNEVADNKINSTEKFLQLVKSKFSTEMEQWLEGKLKS